ncbi:MAG: hypothetical protein AB7R99_07240 [Pseudonocardia sp.]
MPGATRRALEPWRCLSWTDLRRLRVPAGASGLQFEGAQPQGALGGVAGAQSDDLGDGGLPDGKHERCSEHDEHGPQRQSADRGGEPGEPDRGEDNGLLHAADDERMPVMSQPIHVHSSRPAGWMDGDPSLRLCFGATVTAGLAACRGAVAPEEKHAAR